MDAPLWGDTGGHTGTAPTNLHQTPLPRNLLHLVHRQTIRRQSFLVFAHWQRLRRMRNGMERRGGT
ncbi:MAG: hypothetical protein D8B50_01080 [Prevotella sp.]|nr:MAG: hypothetical protein D8B50_01080 [Prevotella sp.]